MGQGAEDAGGYEIDYDPSYEGLRHHEPRWKDEIPVSQMNVSHLRNALRVARMHSHGNTFSCDDNKWDEWVDILESELDSRSNTRTQAKKATVAKPPAPVRGAKQTMKCHCGALYVARVADIKRGYAKSCSKSCAAVRRDFGRPAGKKVK